MDTYWGKLKRNSQHQQKEVLDWAAHLKHLQAVFQEFDPAAIPKEEIMVRCFLEGLKPSVRPQLDIRGRDLNSWEEAVEKAVNAKAKAMLQSSPSTRNMDSRCPRGNKPAKKKERDSNRKNKSTNSPPADTSSGKQTSSTQQASSAYSKKEYCRGPRRGRRRGQDSPATNINTIPKKKEDLFQVEYFYCRKKGYFANWCPQKKK